MHRKNPLSEAHEMYLKTLYRVEAHEVARVGELADGLGVTPGTVSVGLKKLQLLHLVDHHRYGLVTLTPAGRKVAQCVVRRFETLRDVLVEVFGVELATAAEDACAMEHAVSPITVNRMRSLLQKLRAGKGALPRPGRTLRADPCSRCEALGVCQAEAAAR